MAHLPEVVVAQRGAGAQLARVGAVVIVEADAAAPRALVLDLQVDVHRARHGAGAHQRHHLALGAAVERGELGLGLVEVGHAALLQRRHLVAHVERRVVLGAHHAHAAHAGLVDLQEHHALRDLLFGQVDVHRLVARRLVGREQRVARALHVLERALGAEEGRDRLLDGAGVQHGVAAHDVFGDVDLAGRFGGRGRGRWGGRGRGRRGDSGRCLCERCHRGTDRHHRQPHRSPAGRWGVLLHVMHLQLGSQG
ncbi:hypothetical protein D9M68_461000 [compost metagenome]